jgi:hypothetical protein
MKKLLTNSITTSIGFPIKSGTLDHLQSAFQEPIAELAKCFFGNSYDQTKVYILNGLVNSGSGSTYNISAGSVLFNGEVYLVDAVTLTVSGSNIPVGTIATTYYTASNADGVEFTDGVVRNVHAIRKIVIAAGLSGSGDANYTDFIDYKYRPQGGVGQIITWKIPSGSLSTYFTSSGGTSGLGIHPLTLGWAIANGNNGTDDAGGWFEVGYKAADADFGTIGATGGEKVHALTESELPVFTVPGGNYNSGTGSPIFTNKGLNNGADTVYSRSNEVGGGVAHNNLPPFKVRLKIQRIS